MTKETMQSQPIGKRAFRIDQGQIDKLLNLSSQIDSLAKCMAFVAYHDEQRLNEIEPLYGVIEARAKEIDMILEAVEGHALQEEAA